MRRQIAYSTEEDEKHIVGRYETDDFVIGGEAFDGAVDQISITVDGGDIQQLKNMEIDEVSISGDFEIDRVSIQRAEVSDTALMVTEQVAGHKVHKGIPVGKRPDLEPGMIWIADEELRYIDDYHMERRVDEYDDFTIREKYLNEVKSEYVCEWNET